MSLFLLPSVPFWVRVFPRGSSRQRLLFSCATVARHDVRPWHRFRHAGALSFDFSGTSSRRHGRRVALRSGPPSSRRPSADGSLVCSRAPPVHPGSAGGFTRHYGWRMSRRPVRGQSRLSRGCSSGCRIWHAAPSARAIYGPRVYGLYGRRFRGAPRGGSAGRPTDREPPRGFDRVHGCQGVWLTNHESSRGF